MSASLATTPLRRSSHRHLALVLDERSVTTRSGKRVSPRDVQAFVEEIDLALAAGDAATAYASFREWSRREARIARAGGTTNLHELLDSAFKLLGWMAERPDA